MPRGNHDIPEVCWSLNKNTVDVIQWHLPHGITGGCLMPLHHTLFGIQVLTNTLTHISPNGKTLSAVISNNSIQLHS